MKTSFLINLLFISIVCAAVAGRSSFGLVSDNAFSPYAEREGNPRHRTHPRTPDPARQEFASTYHDNDVYFAFPSGCSVMGGSYTIDSFSVTSGQDPNRNIYAGLVVYGDTTGKFTFTLGRKSSDSTANWFNDNVAAAQTTFNHTAGALNFAFLGKLQLIVKGSVYGLGDTLTFCNVALAQGNNGNNWWFGGKQCTYIQNNRVSCQGFDAEGDTVYCVFLRGNNGGNTVGVMPTTLVDTEDWMSMVNDAVTLNQLMMPGSHDAGLSTLSDCLPSTSAGPYTQTQSGSIGQQLLDGARYFDIRVDYDDDTLVTYHRTWKFGCNGQNLQSILDQARDFLTVHTRETAIFKFSAIREGWFQDSTTSQLINNLLQTYSAVIYTNTDSNTNLAKVPLGSLRGKMILVFDYNDFINPAAGNFRYKDCKKSMPTGANLLVYDSYSSTSDYDTMMSDQLSKWQAKAGAGNEYLFLLSWTLTQHCPVYPCSSIAALANEANSQLPTVLYDQIVTGGAPKPNIVYIDFLDAYVTQCIIYYNFQ